MPAKYEAIRDQSIKEGLSTKMAKQKAAKIFNAGRAPGEAPVTGKSPAETTRNMVAAAKSGKGTLSYTPKKRK